MTRQKTLTAKQEAFCQAYVAAGNKRGAAVNAYREAYNSKMKSGAASSNAKRLLRTPWIGVRIEELRTGGTPSEHRLTPKQDAFCLAYVETANASEAYRRAYDVAPSSSAATVNRDAHALLKHPKIAPRIAELLAEHQKRHEVTIDRLVAEHAKIGFANMMDYIRITSGGQPLLDLSRLTRDQAAAIKRVEVETVQSSDPAAIAAANGGEGAHDGCSKKVTIRKIRFELHDKKGSLDSLMKHLGGFKADNEQAGRAQGEAIGEKLSDIEVARWIAFMLSEAVEQQQGGGAKSGRSLRDASPQSEPRRAT